MPINYDVNDIDINCIIYSDKPLISYLEITFTGTQIKAKKLTINDKYVITMSAVLNSGK